MPSGQVIIDADDLRTVVDTVRAMSEVSHDGWAIVGAAADELGDRWQGRRADKFSLELAELTENSVRVLATLDDIQRRLIETVGAYATTESRNTATVTRVDVGALNLD